MNRFFALIAVVPVLLLGGFAVGCGGDDSNGSDSSTSAQSDSAETTAVVRVAEKVARYTTNSNIKGFCSLFAPGRLEEWLGEDVKCEKVFKGGLNRGLNGSQFEIKAVEVDGDHATVTFDYGEAKFLKVDGEWYIDVPETEPPSNSDEQ